MSVRLLHPDEDNYFARFVVITIIGYFANNQICGVGCRERQRGRRPNPVSICVLSRKIAGYTIRREGYLSYCLARKDCVMVVLLLALLATGGLLDCQTGRNWEDKIRLNA